MSGKTKVSTRKGGSKKGAPAHQNSHAFKHNPKSMKSRKIAAMPVYGLCERCNEKIEWRKKYRKYKPLKNPATCNFCHQKTVLAAYHVVCKPCRVERKCCAICLEVTQIIPSTVEVKEGKLKEQEELDAACEGMRERDRRTAIRKANQKDKGDGEEEEEVDSYDEVDMEE